MERETITMTANDNQRAQVLPGWIAHGVFAPGAPAPIGLYLPACP